MAVLGVPAFAIAGRIVALDDLWGDAVARRLLDRLGDARDTGHAAAIRTRAMDDRFALAQRRSTRAQLALAAAERLTSAHVSAVALNLGVSERHLRRAFRETL